MKLFDDEYFIDKEGFKDICDDLQDGLVNAIRSWHDKNEMRLVIVEGYTGVGKSLYALLVASQIYNTRSWDKLRRCFVYHREDFVKQVKNRRRIDGLYVRKPLLVWDDAGNWLHAQDYQKESVKNVCKYFTVARSQWSCIMLTAPDAEDIVRRIRDVKHRILVQIIRNSGRNCEFRRMARFFVKWKSPDKTRQGEDTQITEDFYLTDCPSDLYHEYDVYRHSMVADAINEL